MTFRTLFPRSRRTGACLLSIALGVGCSDGGTTGPAVGDSPGTIVLSVVTDRNGTDADGYTVTLDDGSGMAVTTNGTLTIDDVAAGRHTLRLEGNDGRCYVLGLRTQAINVSSGNTANVTFTIRCFRRPIGFESEVPTRPVGGFTKITIVDDDGSFPTQFGAGSVSVQPSWSPNGMLAYGYGDETTGTSEMALSLAEPLGVPINTVGRGVPLAWSGDGAQITLAASCGPERSRSQVAPTRQGSGVGISP